MNRTFQALADKSRRTILKLLNENDMTAGDIAAHFNMAKPSVSHHLKVLKDADLITADRQGQNIIYSLNLTVFQELTKAFFDLFERSNNAKS